jgi:hypothetical protein
MNEIKISSWKFLVFQVLLIVVVAGATYYLVMSQLSMHIQTSTVSTSITSQSNGSTVINQTNSGPYLTLSNIQKILGLNSNVGTYSANHCAPGNSTSVNLCANIAFFSTKGHFNGWIIRYNSSVINLNEILLLNNRNSSSVYRSLITSIYPNSTTSYYPANLILNSTNNGALYSVQSGSNYTNIYVLKGNNTALVLISGANYTRNYINAIVNKTSSSI